MEVVIKKNDNTLEVEVKGKLDTNTAPDLEKKINKELDGIKKIRMDLKELDYISSAGLRVVLIFHKGMASLGGELVISNPKEEVMDVFDMTGFSSFLNIEE